VHQDLTEARAEAEAAAEQRFAAALALERAEFIKQARSLSRTCGTQLYTALAFFRGADAWHTINHTASHVIDVAA